MQAIKTITCSILLIIVSTTAYASPYRGVITGTAHTMSEFAPFNDGDAFTLTFLADTSNVTDVDSSPDIGNYWNPLSSLSLTLDIGGFTGSFAAFAVEIYNDQAGGIDGFTIFTALDVPENLFNGDPNSNVYVNFQGASTILQNDSLAQTFSFTDFTTQSLSFDGNAGGYTADLQMSSGTYGPVVPIPPALVLFLSGILGLLGIRLGNKKI